MGYDSCDEEVYEEFGRGNRFLGFMFGNVNESGDLDVDYLDDDAKEHLAAFSDKLGPSLIQLDHTDAVEQEYDGDKADNAVDYFDFDEDFKEEDHDPLLPRNEYDLYVDQVSLASLGPTTTTGSVFVDENYDEEEIEEQVEHDHVVVTENKVDVDVRTISLPAEEGQVFSDKSCTLTPTPLPVLCMEDGLAILRFSEIFGADHDRLSYSVPKYRHTKSMDVSDDIVEDDEEEAFLQGFQSLTVKHGISESSFKDDDSNFTKLKDSCFVAEPMKQDLTVHVSEERERQSPLVSKFFPLDQQDWEDGIVWGNSPIASDSDVESCEISGPDHEASVKNDTEPDNGPQNKLHNSSSSNSSLTFSASRCHPQILCLDADDCADGTRQNAGEKLQQSNGVRQLIRKLASQNRDMLEGSWLDQIIWDPDSDTPTEKPKLIIDLQDEQMLFEVLDNKDSEHLRLHSMAMMVSRPLNPSNGDSFELIDNEGQFGWQDVASDRYYSKSKTAHQPKSNSKKHTARGIKVYQSQPALGKKKSAACQGRTTVTGADHTDPRRLSMEAAREVLLRFGVSDELIARQTRWHRIAMISKLSSEQAASGVKVQSFSSAIGGDENENGCEGNNGDLDSFAGDLENLLDAEECDQEGLGLGGDQESKHDKPDGVKGLKKRSRPSIPQTEEKIEDEAAEQSRLLMDDDKTARKKKKVRFVEEEAGLAPGSQTCFGIENPERPVKQIIGAAKAKGSYTSKENPVGDAKVAGNLPKRNKTGKCKGISNIDTTEDTDLMNKKLIISINGDKGFQEKKSARQSFNCGACDQPGHMRTNKNCPKYIHGEDIHRASQKSATLNPSCQSQPETRAKELIPKSSATKISVIEASQVENLGLSTKLPRLKFKCGPNKMKSEDVPVEPPSVNHDTESQKVTVVIQAPANTDREEVESSQQQGPSAEAKKELHRYHKKIVIKLPKKLLI
ncbi:transcription initiation factor TFIID subunit 1-like [Prunus avium]|uniref:Transcription initiation factor TFIID subunit 1-like n=1 Tax=Prunus avium TaxID=42229 RepID=A0A6P5SAY5_PRUAV|nr:transcription initiation factor TFIID subunit 1-like [Prunus avium]